MFKGARRHGLRFWKSCARRARMAPRIGLVSLAISGPACAEILSANYADPTTRYAHGVLGDAVEYGALILKVAACDDCAFRKSVTLRFTLPENRVFEDIAPRLTDLDGDGLPEVVVIETESSTGASLAIYDETGKIAATPHIGRTNRWLAPLGAADLDGDGKVELAYIDRPHLAKILRVWRFDNGNLVHVADKAGLTNHRIGQNFISGGIRDCGEGSEIVTANADWSRIIVTVLKGGKLASRDIGPFKGGKSLTRALSCKS